MTVLTASHTSAADRAAPRARTNITRDRDSLLAALVRIDVEGWDSPTAVELLQFVLVDLVQPLVADVGVQYGGNSQAEATGWETAWEVLRSPSLRLTSSPWGVVWTAVRRAVLAEQMAAEYGTQPRTAWRLARPRSAAAARTRPLLSLTAMVEQGWDPPDDQGPDQAASRLGQVLLWSADALEGAGWPREQARDLVEAIATSVSRRGATAREVVGWRDAAGGLGLPPWQVRRLMVLLIGVPGWAGLLERLLRDGPGVLVEPGIRAALRSTRVQSRRSPVLAYQRAAA